MTIGMAMTEYEYGYDYDWLAMSKTDCSYGSLLLWLTDYDYDWLVMTIDWL